MVLHRHDRAGEREQCVRVDRLDRIAVDHTSRDAVLRERVRCLQRLVHGDPGRHERDVVSLAQRARAADRKLVVRSVQHGRVRARRAEIRDALEIGHRPHELGGLVPVAGVEHGRAVDRPELGQVFEAHLGGAVLADRDARVRAAQPERRAADRGHADEVVGTGEERGERGAERFPAQHLQPDRRRDHLLLGDVHLEEPVRVRVAEDLGEGRVRHLAVERDDVSPLAAERGKRLAVGLARRDLGADLVARPVLGRRLEAVRLAVVRLRHRDDVVADPAHLRKRLLGVLGRGRLAVPAALVLQLRVALALDRLGDDRGRTTGGRLRLAVGRVDLLDVVPVDLDRVPAERAEALGVRGEIPAVHRLAALAEPVHVDDRGQVVELVEGGVLGRLPHRSLGHLAVAADHPDPEREPVELLAGERHADADRETLAERAGGDVDPGEHRCRVALEPRAELPVGEELLLRDDAGGAEEAVDERRRVPFREDEPVVGGAARLVEVVAEVSGEEDGGEIGRRHRRGRMTGARLRARAHRVDPQLLSQLPPELVLVHGLPLPVSGLP